MSHSLQHSHCLCKLDYRRAITSSISNGIFMSCRDEHEHYSNRANWLRAAVLGANDGLVSVASIMLGVGAGSTDQHTLLLSGVSALVAGTRTFLSTLLFSSFSYASNPFGTPCRASCAHMPVFHLSERQFSTTHILLLQYTLSHIAVSLYPMLAIRACYLYCRRTDYDTRQIH